MSKVYTIVKKKSPAHQAMLANHDHKNSEILALGEKHVMIPSKLSVNYGHTVSHAKNRTVHRRLANAKVAHVLIDGVKKAIRMKAGDLRTFKKLSAPQA